MTVACAADLCILDISEEKQHHEFVEGIEQFNKKALSHTEPQIKNSLPDSSGMPSLICL